MPSSILEIWEELYGDNPIPEEFQPFIKTITVWVDRKYGKKIKDYNKKVNRLEKKLDSYRKQQSPSKLSHSKKRNGTKKQKKIKIKDKKYYDRENREKSSKKEKGTVIIENLATTIFSVYNNGILIHGPGRNSCKDIVKEYPSYYSSVYAGWVIPGKVILTKKHSIMDHLRKVCYRILPYNKDEDLVIDSNKVKRNINI